MGIFVVFEGGEASGKTTQCEALRRRACSAGLAVTSVREPGGTSTAERVRQIIKHGDRIEPLAELFLFSAARASLMASVVRPALERGDTVISDRYIYSTLAYQGYGRRIDLETVRHFNAVATQGLVPELVVLLDLAPECGLQRLSRPERQRAAGPGPVSRKGAARGTTGQDRTGQPRVPQARQGGIPGAGALRPGALAGPRRLRTRRQAVRPGVGPRQRANRSPSNYLRIPSPSRGRLGWGLPLGARLAPRRWRAKT